MQPYPPPSRPNPAPWITLAAVGLIAAGLLGFAVGRSSVSTAPASTRTVTAAAETRETERPARTTEAATTEAGIQPGTHVVGRDVQPGEYRTAGPAAGSRCYWSRLSDTSGDRGTIIANDIADGATTVTLTGEEAAFKTSGCKPWVRVS